MNLQVIKIRVLLWLRRILLYSLYIGLVFFTVSIFLLQNQKVQEKLLSKLTQNFSEVTGFKVTFSSFYFSWFDRVEFHNLQIKDPLNNTMIRAGNLFANFDLTSLLRNGNVNIDGALLDSADIKLIEIQESDTSRDINFNVWINRINAATATADGSGKSPKVNIAEIAVKNSQLSFNNTDADSIHDSFDYNHFALSLENIESQNFQVIGDTIQFQLNSFQAVEQKSKLPISDLRTYFRICQTSMEFLGLYLKIGESTVTDTVTFHYDKLRDLNDFNTKVNFHARLKNTVIDPRNLEVFAPGVKVIGQPVHLDGNIKGKVNRFFYNDMKVSVGNTTLKGKLDMDGLPSISETFINLTLRDGSADIRDLRFLFPENIYSRLRIFGKFDVTGSFIGFRNDFVANGKFDTHLGKIRSDINLKVNEKNVDETTYRGNLDLQHFDIGSYLQDTVNFQHVTLIGQINGKGITEKTANFILNGKIQSIGLRNYNYTNITTNAQFAKQLFNGALTIDDPNLKFNATGSVDFRNKKNTVKIKANLDTVLLHELKLTDDYFLISSYVDIDSRGLEVDSLFGDALFKNSTLHYKNEVLHLDSIHIISSIEKERRKLTLRSSLADINLEGNYFYSSLFSDMQKFFFELYLNIKNDKKDLLKYYTSKKKKTQEYNVKIDVKLNDINPLITLANLDMRLSKNSLIQGNFSNGYTTIFKAYTNIDSIALNNKVFYGNEIEFTGSKIRDSASVLSMLSINSEKQFLSKGFQTKQLLVEAIWNKDHINLDVDFDQDGASNLVRLKTQIDFQNDSTKIKILPSRISFLEKDWLVSQQNYILTKGKEWEIHHLAISHNGESILMNGSVSTKDDRELTVQVTNLNLDILNSISTEKFAGTLNANLHGKNFYSNPYLQNIISIKDLTINNFLIGDIQGTNAWNQDARKFDLSFYIDRISKRIISVEGYYDPEDKVNPLNVTATLQNANLKIAEPIVRGIFSNLGGTLTGDYTIKGTFSRPLVYGEGKFEGGKMTIDYLKTTYAVEGSLGMEPTKIVFKDLILTDIFSNKGTLTGYLAHDGYSYSSMNLYLESNFKNIQLLNTTSKDNSLFYGQAMGTGNLIMKGPISNLNITATGKSEKNTRIYIPLGGTATIEKEEYINFVHFTDSALAKGTNLKAKEKVELSGLTLDLNLEITPDAYAEIIIDAKSGDIIRGRGNGDLKLQLDTKGEFNMFGSIEFLEGGYNFTLFDIINKEFKIQKGSRISWYGDPYQGVLALTASYRQLASLSPIFSTQTTGTTSTGTTTTDAALKRRYPVEVLLKLDGPMLSPTINFDIDAKDLPSNIIIDGVSLKIGFDAFKAKLDEQELKAQVFSLIVLRKFKPYGESISTNGSVFNSVSELFSNQLSYWISQVDQNLEVDLDLGSLDQEAFNTFQLRLSYSLMNGRLRITRDGMLNNTYQTNRSEVSTLVGDITVDYLLTADGTFKIKMYSRSNTNVALSSIGNQSAITTGVSLIYTQNFNEFKDLLSFARAKRRKEIESSPSKEELIDDPYKN